MAWWLSASKVLSSSFFHFCCFIPEPRHDKTNKVTVRTAKTLIRQGECRMPSLIRVFAVRTVTLLVLSCRGSPDAILVVPFQFDVMGKMWNLIVSVPYRLLLSILFRGLLTKLIRTVSFFLFTNGLTWHNSQPIKEWKRSIFTKYHQFMLSFVSVPVQVLAVVRQVNTDWGCFCHNE